MLNLIFCFQAYKKWLKTNDITSEEPLPGLEHLNHDQLFYLNFAQVWCGSTRPEALRSKLKTAVHAPGKYRYFYEFLHGFNYEWTLVKFSSEITLSNLLATFKIGMSVKFAKHCALFPFIFDNQKIFLFFYFRVTGTLSNSKEFAKAYNCPVGSRMNPVNKCSIW